MNTVSEIEQAISSLTADELRRFRQWFTEFDARAWDAQFEHDAKSGKLERIAEKANADYRAGKSTEL